MPPFYKCPNCGRMNDHFIDSLVGGIIQCQCGHSQHRHDFEKPINKEPANDPQSLHQ